MTKAKHIFLTIKTLLHNFFVQEKAVVAIEMVFAIPIFLIVSMAILEYAIVFTVRSGLEEVSREISRMKQSIDNGGNDTTLTNALHTRITDIVFKPQNVTVSSYVRTPVINQEEFWKIFDLMQDFLQNAAPVSTVTFDANRTIRPAALNLGTSLSFVGITVTYRHEYLTPMARMLGLGNDITISTMSFFQKEDTNI